MALVDILFLTTLMLTGQLMSTLPLEPDVRKCEEAPCPAGKYEGSCGVCVPCPDGFYTQGENREDFCLPCFRGCNDKANLEEVQACSAVADVTCRCRRGFACSDIDSLGKCLECEETSTSQPLLQTTARVGAGSGNITGCVSGFYFNSSSRRCETHTDCASQGLEVWTAGNATHNTICLSPDTPGTPAQPQPQPQPQDSASSRWQTVLCVLLAIGALAIILLTCRRGEEVCFKQLAKHCSPMNHKGEKEATPPKHSGPIEQVHGQETQPNANPSTNRNADCNSHQPITGEQAQTAAGTLGPLHIHSAGTVFVSLLNQFGLAGGEKEADRHQDEKRDCPRSPPIPLSEEERSRESDYIFFPSQEQGKECHVSKEEELCQAQRAEKSARAFHPLGTFG